MKRFVVAMFVAFLVVSPSFAGENPKLVKEIQRKVKIDLSGIRLDKSKEHFVMVQFKIVDQEVEVIKVEGSKRELTDLMLAELAEMFITSDADPSQIHQFKFNFSQE